VVVFLVLGLLDIQEVIQEIKAQIHLQLEEEVELVLLETEVLPQIILQLVERRVVQMEEQEVLEHIVLAVLLQEVLLEVEVGHFKIVAILEIQGQEQMVKLSLHGHQNQLLDIGLVVREHGTIFQLLIGLILQVEVMERLLQSQLNPYFLMQIAELERLP
jgi:hypothetical protein